MKRVRVPILLLVAVTLAALVLFDRPLFVHHAPAAALEPTSMLYLDRPYRLAAVPPELAGAVAIPVHRHARDEVVVRLESAATLYLFHAESSPPDAWQGWKREPFAVELPGAKAQLTTVWSKEFDAGRHAIDPAGRGAASPIVVVGGGDVREVESPASLLRRAEWATRGVSRLGIAALALIAGLIIGAAIFLFGRASKSTSGG